MDNQSKLIVLIFAVIVALGLAIPAFVMSMNCKSNFEGFGDSLTYKQYMCANINKCRRRLNGIYGGLEKFSRSVHRFFHLLNLFYRRQSLHYRRILYQG